MGGCSQPYMGIFLMGADYLRKYSVMIIQREELRGACFISTCSGNLSWKNGNQGQTAFYLSALTETLLDSLAEEITSECVENQGRIKEGNA